MGPLPGIGWSSGGDGGIGESGPGASGVVAVALGAVENRDWLEEPPSQAARVRARSVTGTAMRGAMAAASIASRPGQVLGERLETAGVSLRRAQPPGLTSAP
jgi:hypothetical protein